mgnify:CR=1 FL=1
MSDGEPPRARRVLVTGGGKGIGRAIVERFASEEAAVAFCGRGSRPLDQLASMLSSRGTNAYAESIDVSDEAAVERFVANAAKAMGGIDTVVNNASLTASSGISLAPLLETTTEEWRRTLGVNLDGVFFTSRAAGRIMKAAGRGGTIINISSVHAHVPHLSTPHYDAAKSAVEALTRHLALSLGADGIRVNAIAPGPIDVNTEDDAFSPEQRAALARWTVLNRFGNADEIATVASFLASPAASYITGQTIIVDGGFLLKHGGMGS